MASDYVHTLRDRVAGWLASGLGAVVAVVDNDTKNQSMHRRPPHSQAAARSGWTFQGETALCDALPVESFEKAQDVMNALAVSEAAYAAHELGPHAAAAAASAVAATANSGGGKRRNGEAYGKLDAASDRGLVGVVSLQPSLPHVKHRYVLALTADGKTFVVGFAGTTDARDLWADVNLLQDALPGWEASDDEGDDEVDDEDDRRRESNGRASSTSYGVRPPSPQQQQHLASSPAAHRGFLERAAAVPIEQLAEHAASSIGGCERLLLCGHSLGGAVAQLAALRLLLLRDRERKEEQRRRRNGQSSSTTTSSRHLPVSCVTFAPPALGNAALAHLVERKKWRPLFYSLTYPDDPVPRMLAEIDAGLRRAGGGGAAADASAAADAAGALEALAANDEGAVDREGQGVSSSSDAEPAAPAVVSHTLLIAKEEGEREAKERESSSRWSVPTTTAAASKAASAVAGAVAGAARSAAAAAAARLPAVPSYTHLGTHHSPELLVGEEEGRSGGGRGGGGRPAAAATVAAASPHEEKRRRRGDAVAATSEARAKTSAAAATAAASRLAALAASALPNVNLPPSLPAALADLALPTFSLRVPSLTPHRLSTYRDRLLAISARAWEAGRSEEVGVTPPPPDGSPSSSFSSSPASAVRLSTTLAPPLAAAAASARMPPLPPLATTAATARDFSRSGNRNSSSRIAGGSSSATTAEAAASSSSSYWSAVRRGAARATTAVVGGGVAAPAAAAASATAAAASVVALRIAVRGKGLSSVRGARLQALGSWCQTTVVRGRSRGSGGGGMTAAATAVSPAHPPSFSLSSSSSDLSAIALLPLAAARAAAAATGVLKFDGKSSSSASYSPTPLTLWLRSDFREAALPVALRLPSVWLLGSPPGAEAGAFEALAEAASAPPSSSSSPARRRRGGRGGTAVVSLDGVAVVPAASAAATPATGAGVSDEEGSSYSPSLPLVPFRDQVAAACASMENDEVGEGGGEEDEKRGSFRSSLLRWWRRRRRLGSSSSSSLFPPPDALFVVHGAPFSSLSRRAVDRTALARLTAAAARRGIRVVPIVAGLEEDFRGGPSASSNSPGHALAAVSEVEECYDSGPSFEPSVVALPPAVLPPSSSLGRTAGAERKGSSLSAAVLLSSLFRCELLRRDVATGTSPASRL